MVVIHTELIKCHDFMNALSVWKDYKYARISIKEVRPRQKAKYMVSIFHVLEDKLADFDQEIYMMELNIENSEKSESIYSIVRSERDGIKIVEINERGCDYHDFVLIYYKAAAENIPLLKQLHEKYKKSENTICFIGCISDESDFKSDYSEYYSFFDLNGTMIAEDEYESIVLSAYSCRSGLTHGDPQDWLNFKSSEDLFCLEETGTSVVEMVDHLYGRFKKLFTEHPDSRKIKNVIVSIISNGFDDFSMGDIDSLNKLSEFFEEDYSLTLNINTECKEIAPGILKLTLI